AEDRGRVEVAAAEGAALETLPAAEELRSLLLPDLDVALDRLELLLRNERPHLDAVLEAVPDADLRRERDDPLGDFLRDALVHDEAARRGATLPRRPEGAPQDA